MYYQEACTVKNYKKQIHPYKGKDKPAYGYPDCLTSAAWDAYTKNPFDFTTRKDFLSTISLTCIDKTKDTKMMPPYALTFESLTTDMGPVTTIGGRKIDARHYNGYLIIPGIVYHMASKITNSLVTDRYGNQFKVGIINFIARFGNYTRKTPYLKIHRAYSKYVDITAQYLNGCTGQVQIIPVTMFLVMLYNACFMYQSDKKSNMLITALDTFDLGANVDHVQKLTTNSNLENIDSLIYCQCESSQ
jgi:hypothetical protein